MVFCRSADQQTKACKVKNFSGTSVEVFITGAIGAERVIHKVSSEISEELKANLKGGRVLKATCMKSRGKLF